MATMVMKSAYVTITAVDISSAVTQVSIDYKAEIQDETAMGDATRRRLPGLKDWTANIDVNQDYATGVIDATIFALLGTSTFTLICKPDTANGVSGSILSGSITNPLYTGVGVLESYMPLQAQIGQLHKSRLVILAAGDLSRNVT